MQNNNPESDKEQDIKDSQIKQNAPPGESTKVQQQQKEGAH